MMRGRRAEMLQTHTDLRPGRLEGEALDHSRMATEELRDILHAEGLKIMKLSIRYKSAW